jgi:hypothetical protein
VSPDSQFRSNPVFWIMWLLPAAAVVGGLSTLWIAMRSADRPLPVSYHWEGAHLDQDFAQQRLAASHGIEVDITTAAGECTATLRHAPDDPASLTLTLTHSSDAGLDRVVLLRRLQPGQYRGTCAPLPAGRWRVALEDAAGAWAIRTQFDGSQPLLVLRARAPDGPGDGPT